MTETDYANKLDELDRLMNDADAPMQPERVWSLLAEIARARSGDGGDRPGGAVTFDSP